MFARQVLILAATLAAVAGAVSAGEPRRLWIDPPAQDLAVPAGHADGSASPMSAASAPWPDEASRRQGPNGIEAASAGPGERDIQARGGTAEPPQVPAPTFAAAAPTVSRRTRHRLGPLAGFAAVATPKATIATELPANEAEPGSARDMRRSLGRMRSLEPRNRRILTIYTRS